MGIGRKTRSVEDKECLLLWPSPRKERAGCWQREKSKICLRWNMNWLPEKCLGKRKKKEKNMSPVKNELATRKMLGKKKALSITRDNGIENTRHEETQIPSFFCEPYSSWQKGGIENANKLIRVFFPKGTDFRFVTQREVDEAVKIKNEKPRKILGYRTAFEVALAAGIITSIKSEGVLIILVII